MKPINKSMLGLVMLSFVACNAQIKNPKTETVHIYGNCDMCESTIENAGNIKNVSQVDWNKDTKMASITYDPKKTDKNEILKKIALKGYDGEEFLAPNDVYANLPTCCQYERKAKNQGIKGATANQDNTTTIRVESTPSNILVAETDNHQEIPQLKKIFDSYFAVKDALVKSDGEAASQYASKLVSAIKGVNMSKLSAKEHSVWMNLAKDLTVTTKSIAESNNTEAQRVSFIALSNNMYSLMKASKTETPVFYQYCPMANNEKGANWLSKENAIKNPYYGSQMLNCGKTVETLK